VKAEAFAGIALGLRFGRGLGLLHGGLKASNVLLDADWRIQTADFSPIRLETGEVEPFSGEEWSPATNVCAFAFLLFEIPVGCPDAQLTNPPTIRDTFGSILHHCRIALNGRNDKVIALLGGISHNGIKTPCRAYPSHQ
jgi:hypothetical protein